MTVQTKIVKDDSTLDPNGNNVEGNLNSVDEMPENNQIAYETYKKALGQRLKLKESNIELEAKIKRFEEKELEAEGKKTEAVAYWKKEATESKEREATKDAKFAWSQVKSQLSTKLAQAGCVDSEVAISLIDKEELSSVEVDDQYNVSSEDLTRIVDTLKKNERIQKIKLFGSKVGFNDLTPSGNDDFKEPEADLSKLTSAQIIAKMKE